eukprot:643236_1
MEHPTLIMLLVRSNPSFNTISNMADDLAANANDGCAPGVANAVNENNMFDGENPTDIVLVLLHQYPQIKQWLECMEYHSTVTTARTHAMAFLTSLTDSQPQFTQLIKLIQQELKQRRAQGGDPSQVVHNLISGDRERNSKKRNVNEMSDDSQITSPNKRQKRSHSESDVDGDVSDQSDDVCYQCGESVCCATDVVTQNKILEKKCKQYETEIQELKKQLSSLNKKNLDLKNKLNQLSTVAKGE